MTEPTTANLLAATAYGASNLSRQFLELIEAVRGFHEPREGDARRPMVCSTCRDSSGRRVLFPCKETVRICEIMGMKLDPTDYDVLGITLPASISAAVPEIESSER